MRLRWRLPIFSWLDSSRSFHTSPRFFTRFGLTLRSRRGNDGMSIGYGHAMRCCGCLVKAVEQKRNAR